MGEAPLKTSWGTYKIEVFFDQSRCNRCADRQRCPGYTQTSGRMTKRWQYTPDRVIQYRRRLSEQLASFTQRYRWRAGIEATMSRLKHQMGLASLRVRGKDSVKYAVYLKALGLNIKRAAVYA
ncbi:MAG: transposase [Methylobacter sp.]